MIKIPYGISNFQTLVERGQHFVDRSMYVEKLESFFSSYLFFIRPRKFGKSLFISLLEYYYDILYKDRFDRLFGQYYIGKHPTPLANQYLVLKFDFSQIDTSSAENTFKAFLSNVKNSARTFTGRYRDILGEQDDHEIKKLAFPADVIQALVRMMSLHAPNHKIYLLIDEYDHFANEILSFRFDDFSKMVAKNGFVRKFYEAIKAGTQSGIIDRFFITGVSPITLDSLTSGFNIPANISLDAEFSSMMGFRKSEVLEIMRGVGVPPEQEAEVMRVLKEWYDGYLFGKHAEEYIYNSDMVLYFAAEYSRKQRYPEILLDPNIASDYSKIRRIFKIKGREKEHLSYLDELLTNGELTSTLVHQYELERGFGRDDFISLLYYTGIITIAESSTFAARPRFRMPNYVIKELYYQYFHQIVREQSELALDQVDLGGIIEDLLLKNELKPMVEYIQGILQALSVRDKRKFDEKYVKIIFLSAFFNLGFSHIRSEYEVKKSPTEKGFVDILIERRPPYDIPYQFVMELKYVKKEDAVKAEEVKQAAIVQLQSYLDHDERLQQLDNLKAYVVLFVGNEGHFVEL